MSGLKECISLGDKVKDLVSATGASWDEAFAAMTDMKPEDVEAVVKIQRLCGIPFKQAMDIFMRVGYGAE